MRRRKRRNGRMKDEREREQQFEILVTLVKVGGLNK
jgi:hypothetical protein